MTPVAGSTLTTTAKLKSFTALEAGGDVALVGVDGLTATVENFTIDINQAQLLPGATTTARAIDFSGTKKHSIEVGPDPDGDGGPLTAPTVDLAFAGTIFQAAPARSPSRSTTTSTSRARSPSRRARRSPASSSRTAPTPAR